jgi:Flp pilus assembly pilin Flp
MRDLINDSCGITYGLIYIVIGLIVIGAIWIINGVIVDEFNFVAQDLSGKTIGWGEDFDTGITDLNKFWTLIPWTITIASLIYGLVTAIRKERRGFSD